MTAGSNSPSRRTVCGFGAAAVALPFMPALALAAPTFAADRAVVVLFDPRFADGRALGDEARLRGLVACPVSGDVTACWDETLRHLWQGGHALVAGATTLDALFCLELLCNDAGHRLVHHQQHLADRTPPRLAALLKASEAGAPYRPLGEMPTSQDGAASAALYSWVIAPRRPSRQGPSI